MLDKNVLYSEKSDLETKINPEYYHTSCMMRKTFLASTQWPYGGVGEPQFAMKKPIVVKLKDLFFKSMVLTNVVQ